MNMSWFLFCAPLFLVGIVAIPIIFKRETRPEIMFHFMLGILTVFIVTGCAWVFVFAVRLAFYVGGAE